MAPPKRSIDAPPDVTEGDRITRNGELRAPPPSTCSADYFRAAASGECGVGFSISGMVHYRTDNSFARAQQMPGFLREARLSRGNVRGA
ncbi:hypothetical protein CEXT_764211 [Caerostris extrusa]|uniref:Uncharacterized protein n=1 Tax=Caerostris extrusa TaxID=172846 RepID=A0AAV4X6B4_CAEEX|nr:hypothetical protein CEXT_764211 [Caerostris extrusa]